MDEDKPHRGYSVSYNLYLEAVRFALEMGEISPPMLQRKFGIPFTKCMILMYLLELNKIISEDYASGARKKVIYKA